MLVMLTNTIEYGELLTGRNDSAIVFTIRPFMVKLASAIQAGVVILTLIICGLTKYTDLAGEVEVLVGMLQEGKIDPNLPSILSQITSSQFSVDVISITEKVGAATTIEGCVEGLHAYENTLFNASSASMWGLTAMMCILPIALFVIAWWVQDKKYIISEEKYEEILRELEAKKAIEFIGDQNKVKVSVVFQGREMAYMNLGKEILDQFVEAVGDVAVVDKEAKQEGRSMMLILAPKK